MTRLRTKAVLSAWYLAVCLAAREAPAADLLFDDFPYGIGAVTTVSGGNWVNFAGITDPINIVTASLSHPDIPGVAGRSIQIVGGGGSREDVSSAFPQQGVAGGSDVATYVSFLVQVSSFPGGSGTEDFFFSFADGPSSGNRFGRVFVRNNAGNPEYGLSWAEAAGNYTGSVTTTAGATDFIVLRVTSAAGAAPNDHAALWVNPAIGGAEGAPNLSIVSATTEIAEGLARVVLFQGANSIVGAVDLVRVGTSWAQVTSAALPVELSEFSID